MDGWVVAIEEEPHANSQLFQLRIHRKCLEELKKADYKLQFRDRNAKMKVFHTHIAKPDDDLDPVDAANEQIMLRVAHTK